MNSCHLVTTHNALGPTPDIQRALCWSSHLPGWRDVFLPRGEARPRISNSTTLKKQTVTQTQEGFTPQPMTQRGLHCSKTHKFEKI